MKLHQIAVAVAVLAAGSANAALTTAEQNVLNDANANGRVIFISGASAVQKGFTGIISSTFTGTPIRLANTTASSKDFEAVAGTLAAGTGAWAGQNAIIIYRTKGGSVWGVNPVARAEIIESLDVTAASCGATGSGTSASPYVCGTNTRVPDAGVSDVAPFLFKGPINTEGEIAAGSLNPAELADLTSTAIYGLSFGVPVTSTVPATTKFTKPIVAAIMSGNVYSWNQVDASLPADDIMICRRVPGSGTQAVMNMWAGNFPCSESVYNLPLDRDSTGATWNPVARTFTHTGNIGAPIVIENSTSGDVRNCLIKAVDGGTYTTKDRDGNPVTVDMGAGGHKAIGVLSMDSLKNSTTTGQWQFRALDGAGTITWDNTANPPVTSGTGKFPDLATYENGDWDMQGWISFNVPSRTTGNKKAVLDKFLVNAQNPAVLAGISDLKNVAAAIPGGAYTGPQVLDAAYLNGNQCAPYNRNYND